MQRVSHEAEKIFKDVPSVALICVCEGAFLCFAVTVQYVALQNYSTSNDCALRSPIADKRSLVFWIKRLIPGEGRQAFVNPEH
jgi:hypothetical protein